MILYEDSKATTRIVEVEIRNNGNLVISGQDCGTAPLESWGELDYEFFLTVKKEDKDRVLDALVKHCNQIGEPIATDSQDKDQFLLTLIKKVYGGHFSAFDEFRDFLKSVGISSEFYSYI